MSDLEYPHLADMIRSHLDSDLEYSMSQWIEEEGIPDTEFLAMARDAELGSAWAEAKAALPRDWELTLSVGGHGRQDLVMASASYCYSLRYYRQNVGPARSVPFEMTHADTPAAALRPLAAKLKVMK